MCGFAGFVGSGDQGDLRRMVSALEHRGPDAEGTSCDEALRVYLGHRRLSIVDLAGGRQPMWSADDQLGVVFNGEIYNHGELRAELEKLGHCLRSDHSDTEVLLYAYREWGSGFVERLNGMWAFALFDRRRRRLLLSRDRFGQKPLYYAQGTGPNGGDLAFASELTALTRHSRVETRLSTRAIQKYFAHGYVPAPESIYEGIRKLPAGANLTWDIGRSRSRVERYWDFRLEPAEPADARREAQLDEELRQHLSRAVSRRMVADVPVGVFLSGGIDSSAITALATRDGAAGDLQTFSIGFDDTSFDESASAQRAAEWIGTRHHCTRFSRDDLQALAPEIAERLDEPMADPSLLPTHLLCRVAAEQVKVALGGDGADELFAGYDPFRALGLARAYAAVVPQPVHRAIRMLAARFPVAHRNMSLGFRLNRTLAGLSHARKLWNPVWMGPLAPEEVAELLEEPVCEEDLYSEAIEAWEACAGGCLVSQTLQFYTQLYLQNDILTKVDRASMLHGLEVRSPFLDRDLVEFIRRLPQSQKIHHGRTKVILKRALGPVLPHEIRHRAKKGFGIPIGAWFRDGDLEFGPRDRRLQLLAAFLEGRLAQHRSGRADHRLYLFSHWLLQRWTAAHLGDA